MPISRYEEQLPSRLRDAGLVLAVEQLGLAFGELSLDGKWINPGQRLVAILGLSPAEIKGKSVWKTADIDQMTDVDFRRLLSGETPCISRELKITTGARGTVWVNCAFCLVKEKSEETPRVFVLLQEITDRKKLDEEHREVADKLIHAQETERARIARELHDDIGQSLAVLRMQMLRAGQLVSDAPNREHPSIPLLSETVLEIANKVSHLSHRLHSPLLEYFGLKSAMQNACREFQAQYRIKVEYSFENMEGKIDGTVGLCFLRVLQEALHNIEKHSAAKSVQVRLTLSPTDLKLLVIDDGKGFDLEQARLAAGLGLISMRERVKLVEGHFEIKSVLGKGTQICASAPRSGVSKSKREGD